MYRKDVPGHPESQCYGESLALRQGEVGVDLFFNGWLVICWFFRLLVGEQILPLPSQARRRI